MLFITTLEIVHKYNTRAAANISFGQELIMDYSIFVFMEQKCGTILQQI